MSAHRYRNAPVFELRVWDFRVVVVSTAAPTKWFAWNRYPSGIIGAVVRIGRHKGLSVVWRVPR